MSEQATSAQEPLPGDDVAPQNQWALVLRTFRKRRQAVISLYVIVFLITISIFAPLIANDRPITYVGQNRFAYKQAYRNLTVVLSQLAKGKKSNGESTIVILLRQLDIIESCLAEETPEEKITQLSQLRQQIITLSEAKTSLVEKTKEISQIKIAFRKSFHFRNIELKFKRYWPVLSAFNGIEIAFMSFNLLMLLLPFYNWLNRTWFKKKSVVTTIIMLVVIPVILGLGWWLTVPYRLDRIDYKSAVVSDQADQYPKAPVVIRSSLWTPITYGIDEDNLGLTNSPPIFMSAKKDKSDDASSAQLGEWDTPHLLGTDGIGRDLMARMIWGGRISLAVGVVAVSIYVSIGIIVGSIAGYFGGWIDLLTSRLIEMVIVFPSFFLILTVIAFIGPSIFNIMIIIGLTGWTGVARLVRGEFLRVKAQEFVLAGRALGFSPFRIIYRHVLPNALAPVLVSATFGVAGAILTESALSFLGLGITIPKPSWGGLLFDARSAMDDAPWQTYFPGLAIFITITAYNLVGEAFRDAADPRLRGK